MSDSPSETPADEIVDNFIASGEIPDSIPKDLQDVWKERIDYIKEIRGF